MTEVSSALSKCLTEILLRNSRMCLIFRRAVSGPVSQSASESTECVDPLRADYHHALVLTYQRAMSPLLGLSETSRVVNEDISRLLGSREQNFARPPDARPGRCHLLHRMCLLKCRKEGSLRPSRESRCQTGLAWMPWIHHIPSKIILDPVHVGRPHGASGPGTDARY